MSLSSDELTDFQMCMSRGPPPLSQNGAKMGYSTTHYVTPHKCPSCSKFSFEMHRPFLYKSLEVCAWCFDIVKVTQEESPKLIIR